MTARLDVTFTIPREPVAKGRPRFARTKGGGVRTFTDDKTHSFELDVAAVARAHVRQVIEGPVSVDILAVLKRPKRLFRKKDPDGLRWATKRPDADNIRKAVLDGLNGVLRDDAQVVAGQTVKVYAEKEGLPRTVVRIRVVDEANPSLIAASIELGGGLARVLRTEERRTRHPWRTKPMREPRYDEVFADGMEWLDGLV